MHHIGSARRACKGLKVSHTFRLKLAVAKDASPVLSCAMQSRRSFHNIKDFFFEMLCMWHPPKVPHKMPPSLWKGCASTKLKMAIFKSLFFTLAWAEGTILKHEDREKHCFSMRNVGTHPILGWRIIKIATGVKISWQKSDNFNFIFISSYFYLAQK